MIRLEYFTDATVAWENTLSVLNKTKLVIVFYCYFLSSSANEIKNLIFIIF